MKKIVKDQLWVRDEAGMYTVGLTNQAQDDLGSVAFVSLPPVGTQLIAGESFAEIEAEKAVSELTSPVSGTVFEVNRASLDDPTVLDVKNEDYAWLLKITDVSVEEFRNL